MLTNDAISIVIPVYNAEETLAALMKRLATVLPALAPSYEIILVNDGSRDHSWEIVKELARSIPAIHGIDLMRNYGQHNATLVGIRAAKGPIIITMDDDGQHPPEEIGKLLEKLAEGYDLVYGYAIRPQHEWWRNPLTGVAKWFLEKMSLFPNALRNSAFRVFRAPVRAAFVNCQTPYPIVDVLLRWGTNRIGFVAVRHAVRQSGRSSSTVLRLITLVMHAVTAYSIAPVRWVEMAGVGLALLGIYFIALGTPMAGTLWVATGMIVAAIGLAGEYAVRAYHAALGKPQAVVREETGRKP